MAVNEHDSTDIPMENAPESLERGIRAYRSRVQENVANLRDALQRGADESVVDRELQKAVGHLSALYALQIQQVNTQDGLSAQQVQSQQRLLQEHFTEEAGLLAAITEEVLNS